MSLLQKLRGERVNSRTFYLIMQEECGDEESQRAVEKLLPQKVKKRRKIETEDGVS